MLIFKEKGLRAEKKEDGLCGLLEERAGGLYQFSVAYDPKEPLILEAFLSQGLRLPPSLREAHPKRRRDYLSGRYCVKKIYERLGLRLSPPEIGGKMGPRWPERLLGSISHKEGLASAVIALKKDEANQKGRPLGLGLDLEETMDRKAPGRLKRFICVDERELSEIMEALSIEEAEALTLIFSGKESLFKALYPSVGRYFDFKAARVFASSPKGPSMPLAAMPELWLKLLIDLPPYPKGLSWSLVHRRLEGGMIETLIFGEGAF